MVQERPPPTVRYGLEALPVRSAPSCTALDGPLAVNDVSVSTRAVPPPTVAPPVSRTNPPGRDCADATLLQPSTTPIATAAIRNARVTIGSPPGHHLR